MKNKANTDTSLHEYKNLSIDSPIMEAYRILRTNIEFSSSIEKIQVLLITSAFQSEGKSTTAANLARTFALSGSKTLVVDLDLRRPVQHRIHSLDNSAGITEILTGKVSSKDAIQPTETDNLYVLCSGFRPPNPSEMLSAPKLTQLISELRDSFDMIILDTPPITMLADAAILTKTADASLLIVSAGNTNIDDMNAAVEALKRTGTKLLGTVLNNVKKESSSYKYKYYYRY